MAFPSYFSDAILLDAHLNRLMDTHLMLSCSAAASKNSALAVAAADSFSTSNISKSIFQCCLLLFDCQLFFDVGRFG